MAADAGEILFGGAAGGGKSDSLLTAALQFVDVPGYAAILFRKTYSDLSLPNALMSRAAAWLSGTAARWNSDTKTWTFPSGATLTFGYLDGGNDRYRYQSSEYQYVAFDELTQFQEADYLYLFSRLRRLAGSPIPVRMRAASNPGNIGHQWVKRRFLTSDAQAAGRLFIPAKLADNPHLDVAQYAAALQNLDAFTRRQLLEGSWEEFEGSHYHPRKWPRYRSEGGAYVLPGRVAPASELLIFVVVDPATSAKSTADHTAMLVCGLAGPYLLILHAFRQRIDVGEIVPALAQLCRDWRPSFVGLEEVSFSKLLTRDAARHPDIPPVRVLKPKGQGKLARAVPAIVKAERGEVLLPEDESPWLDDLITELTAFTGSGRDAADDQADALSWAVLASQAFAPVTCGQPCLLIPAPHMPPPPDFYANQPLIPQDHSGFAPLGFRPGQDHRPASAPFIDPKRLPTWRG